ncbi:MAG TPA: HAD family hydrolase, partial [Gemmatimonadota bacterium]|nr:HAD family hydrolase [Gemmatimonadota bacterium]
MTGADGLRIAMWSGPRNISTALMRSWEARGDAAVVDEPFYAHYLKETGRDHPGRDAVIAAEPVGWRAVAGRLALEPIPGGKAIFYQKHMAHHLLPGMEGIWMNRLTHAFLIRDPAEMLTSLVRVTPDPGL